MNEQLVLLNPGPVNLSAGVRGALSERDVCHREEPFAALTRDVAARLARIYPGAMSDYVAVLLTGSGTTAVEAMLASLVQKDGRVAVLTNGVYGERMDAMVRAHGKATQVFSSAWLDPMTLDDLRTALTRDASITHVAAVHNETTTGRLNDLEPLAALCREHGRDLLIDTVSSFGAEAIDFAIWRPAAIAATANKCLHGAPGIAFVLVRRELLEACGGNAPAVVLDLSRYREQQRSGFSPFTQATHVLYALRQALIELDEAGGWELRRSRYRAISRRIRNGLAELGVATVLPIADYSSMITSFHLPPGRTYPDLHDRLLERGFVVYAGQGDFRKTLFRIANMGELHDDDIDRLLAAFQELLSP